MARPGRSHGQKELRAGKVMQRGHEEGRDGEEPDRIGENGRALVPEDGSYLVHRDLPVWLAICSHAGENLSRTFGPFCAGERMKNDTLRVSN